MVEIGGWPILWHILNTYSYFGFNEFIIALGYKGHVIKEYFLNYYYRQNDFSINLRTGKVNVINNIIKNWELDLIDTGLNTMTGGRLHRLQDRLNSTFMVTYGDGVANINLNELLAFHKSHGKLATVTAVRPSARFGGLKIDGDMVVEFKEKPQTGEGWINGGFFVFEIGVLKYLNGDSTILEREPLENLTRDGELMVFKHEGFWQCMDTLRDREMLENMWVSGKAPWQIWDK